jgi:hypothetical protein
VFESRTTSGPAVTSIIRMAAIAAWRSPAADAPAAAEIFGKPFLFRSGKVETVCTE